MASESDKLAADSNPADDELDEVSEETESEETGSKNTESDQTGSDETEEGQQPAAEVGGVTKKGAKPRRGKKKAAAADAKAAGWVPTPMVKPRTAWLLAIISAVLCPISFAGFDIWPLAFVAWVPLIVAMRGQAPKRAAMLGWVAGFGMTMIGFNWLIGMLEVFSGFPPVVCALFAAILCAQMGGRIALMGWLYARATHRGHHHGLSFIAAFAASELVWPLLFPWYFGGGMHDTPIMMQTADIGGPILVGVILIGVNLALAEVFQKPIFQAAPDRRLQIGGAAALVFALAYGAFRLSDIDAAIASSPSLRVGMVQGNSKLKGRRKSALEVNVKHTRDLKEQGVDLVVWSEGAASRAFNVTTYEKDAKARIGNQLKVPSIIGVTLFEKLERKTPKGRRARYFNSALMVDETGAITGRYDKQFLLMFGEYLPFGDDFPVLYEWSPHSGAFSPGTSFEPVKVGDHRVSVMICYEDIIPGFVSKLVDAGDPHLFVNMTNDAWFGDTIEPWQHLALAKFRSVEHRKFMARVTNTGITAMIDPLGRITKHGGSFVEESLIADAHYMSVKTVFTAVGNKPWWLVTLLAVFAAFVRRTKKVKPADA